MRRFRSAAIAFVVGGLLFFLVAAGELVVLRRSSLSQLKWWSALSALGREAVSNWQLAVAVGLVTSVIVFTASFSRPPSR